MDFPQRFAPLPGRNESNNGAARLIGRFSVSPRVSRSGRIEPVSIDRRTDSDNSYLLRVPIEAAPQGRIRSDALQQGGSMRDSLFEPSRVVSVENFRAPRCTSPAPDLRLEQGIKKVIGSKQSLETKTFQQARVLSPKPRVLSPSYANRVKSVSDTGSAPTCDPQSTDSCNKAQFRSLQLPVKCLGGLKLAVFDFDCTLTSFHVFGSLAGTTLGPEPKLTVPPPHARSESGQMRRLQELDADPSWGPGVFAMKAFGGLCRVRQLHSLLEALQDNGVECMILSRGMVQPIRTCLEKVGLLQFFSQLIASEGCAMGTTDYDEDLSLAKQQSFQQRGATIEPKSVLITRLAKEKRLDFHQIVFIDDDLSEVEKAKQIVKTVHVASRKGMQEAEMQVLRSMLVPSSSNDDASTEPGSSNCSLTDSVDSRIENPRQDAEQRLETLRSLRSMHESSRKSLPASTGCIRSKMKCSPLMSARVPCSPLMSHQPSTKDYQRSVSMRQLYNQSKPADDESRNA